MRREFWQSHDCSGYSCRVSITWDTPRDMPELPPERMAAAEEIAEDILVKLAKKPLEVVSAMMGRTAP